MDLFRIFFVRGFWGFMGLGLVMFFSLGLGLVWFCFSFMSSWPFFKGHLRTFQETSAYYYFLSHYLAPLVIFSKSLHSLARSCPQIINFFIG